MAGKLTEDAISKAPKTQSAESGLYYTGEFWFAVAWKVLHQPEKGARFPMELLGDILSPANHS